MNSSQGKPRTPSKMRSRREAYKIDEIPTRDGSQTVRKQIVRQNIPNDNRRYRSRPSASEVRRSCPNLANHQNNYPHVRHYSDDRRLLTHMYANGPFREPESDSIASSYQPVPITINNSADSRISMSTMPSLEQLTSSMQVLSQNIYNMWKKGKLCDVLLKAGGRTFYAHKLVMAASCERLPSYSDESKDVLEIILPKVRAETMEEVLNYFYTSKLSISSDNVEDFLEISKQLGISKIMNSCFQYLKRVTLSNAVRHRTIANRFNLSDVVKTIDKYVHEHFAALVTTSSFLNADFHLVYDIVSSDMLTALKELQIFHACASWINHNKKDRLKYAKPLVGIVRFANISPAEIVAQVEPIAFMSKVPECKKMLYNAFRHHALSRDLSAIPSTARVGRSRPNLTMPINEVLDDVSEQSNNTSSSNSSPTSSARQTPIPDTSPSPPRRQSSIAIKPSSKKSYRVDFGPIDLAKPASRLETQHATEPKRKFKTTVKRLINTKDQDLRLSRNDDVSKNTDRHHLHTPVELSPSLSIVKPASRFGSSHITDQPRPTASNSEQESSSSNPASDFGPANLAKPVLRLGTQHSTEPKRKFKTAVGRLVNKMEKEFGFSRTADLSKSSDGNHLHAPVEISPSYVSMVKPASRFGSSHIIDQPRSRASISKQEMSTSKPSPEPLDSIDQPRSRASSSSEPLDIIDQPMPRASNSEQESSSSKPSSAEPLEFATVDDFDSGTEASRSTHLSTNTIGTVTFREPSPSTSMTHSERPSTPELPPPPIPNVIFVVGGVNQYSDDDDNAYMGNTVQQFDPLVNDWSVRSKLPHALHHCAVTETNGTLFITGGQVTDSNNSIPSRDCYIYDVFNDNWREIASLKTARARHAIVNLEGDVYVLGGEDCVEMSIKSMEIYDMENDTWIMVKSMNDARVGLAAICHRRRILAVGGMLDIDEKLLLDTVEVYDADDDKWTFKYPLPVAVCDTSLAEIDGIVYMVGGYMMRDREPLSVDSVFRYRDETDTWEGFMTLRVPRHGAVVAVLGTKLYIIGGESSATMGHALSNVECIDVDDENHVTGMAPLMSSAFGISGCAFTFMD